MALAVGATSKGRVSNSGSSATTTGVTTTASGSIFVVGAVWDNGFNFSSIADSKSNTYTLIGSELAFGSVKARLWYVENGAGGASHTATVTVNTSPTYLTVFFLEITGGATSGSLDQSNARSDAASPFTLAAGLTTTQADEILVSMIVGDSASNPATLAESGLGSSTVHSGASETDGSQFEVGGLATSIKTSTGTFNPSWTMTGGSTCGVFLATFKAAAAAGGLAIPRNISVIQAINRAANI